MKKGITLGIAMLLSFSFALANSCDINGDDNIDLTDAVYLAQLRDIDLNNDGEINILDATILSEAIGNNDCNQFWDLLNPEEEQPPQAHSSSSGSSTIRYDLDKRRDYDFYPHKGNGRTFILNEERYKFKYLGINIFGRPIIAITSDKYSLPLRYEWLKENSGELWFYKTKYNFWEKEYINYEFEMNNKRMGEITISKVEDNSST